MIESPVSMTFLSDVGQDEQISIVNQAANDTSNVHGARDDQGLNLIDEVKVDKTDAAKADGSKADGSKADGSKADGAQMGKSNGIVNGFKKVLTMVLNMLQWLG